MKIKKLREYMLLRSRNSQFRPQDYPGYNAVEKVAICFRSGEHDRQIQDFARSLEAEGKQVSLLAYLPCKRKEVSELPAFPHFTQSELNWYGKPRNEEVEAFLAPHYGVFISLNEQANSPLDFIGAAIGADFNIGIRSTDHTRYDLIVGLNKAKGLAEVFKEIKYYLGFINQRR